MNTVNRKGTGIIHLASNCFLLEEKKKGVCGGWSTFSAIIRLKRAKRQLIWLGPFDLWEPVNLDRALEGWGWGERLREKSDYSDERGDEFCDSEKEPLWWGDIARGCSSRRYGEMSLPVRGHDQRTREVPDVKGASDVCRGERDGPAAQQAAARGSHLPALLQRGPSAGSAPAAGENYLGLALGCWGAAGCRVIQPTRFTAI